MRHYALAAVIATGVVAISKGASAIGFAGPADGFLLNGVSNPVNSSLISSISGSGTFGAMICDSSNGSKCVINDGGGNDVDLNVNLGNLIVISRYGDATGDGIADAVNDATPAQAGASPNMLTFNFTRPTPIIGLTFVDQDAGETLEILANNVSIFSLLSGPGNGSVNAISLNAVDVTSLKVNFSGSGGVALIATPIPAALPLLGTALAGLGIIARRRRMPSAA